MSTSNARLYAGAALLIAALLSLALVDGADWLLSAATALVGVALLLTSFAEDIR